MTQDADLLIVGGGLTGSAMALAAARIGLTAVLIDAAPLARRSAADFDGRSYALSLASQRMLRRLGLWEALAPEAQPIRRITVSDGRAGEGAAAWLGFDQAEIEDGPMGHMVEDRHLRPALLAALEGTAGLRALSGSRVVAQEVTPGGVQVTLEGGAVLRGALLIGADGRTSGVAARAGIARHSRDYHQTAVVCAVTHERPHDGTAHQFFMPGGPLAILPLQGNRASIVWSEARPRAEAMLALDDAGFLEALRPAFGSFLGQIALAGTRHGYPLGLTVAERMVAPRVALIGDAAHGIHPIAGQGLNAGLRDLAALADVLRDAHRRGEDPGSAPVLDRYLRWRRPETAALVAATDGFNRLFSNDNPAVRAIRDAGLGLIGHLPPLRRAFIRQAAGLSGRVPSLMQA